MLHGVSACPYLVRSSCGFDIGLRHTVAPSRRAANHESDGSQGQSAYDCAQRHMSMHGSLQGSQSETREHKFRHNSNLSDTASPTSKKPARAHTIPAAGLAKNESFRKALNTLSDCMRSNRRFALPFETSGRRLETRTAYRVRFSLSREIES